MSITMGATKLEFQNIITTGECVYDRDNVKIFRLSNGKFQGFINYKGLVFETTEANGQSEARQFAYFIMHEMSEII